MLHLKKPKQDEDSWITKLKIHEPEALLTHWMDLSIMALTTAMLFYHVTRLYSIKTNKNLAAFIAIALLGTGVVYLSAAIYNYIPRTNDIINECYKNRHFCNDEQLERILVTKRLNIAMSAVTIMIEVLIGILIFNTIGKVRK